MEMVPEKSESPKPPQPTPTESTTPEPGEREDLGRWAVIIGISDYQFSEDLIECNGRWL